MDRTVLPVDVDRVKDHFLTPRLHVEARELPYSRDVRRRRAPVMREQQTDHSPTVSTLPL